MTWLGEKRFTIRRSPPIVYVDGVARHPDDAVETTFSVSGVLRPLDDRTAAALPEGIRQRARWRFYTARASALKIFSVDSQEIPDTLEVEGEALHFFAFADNSAAIQGSPLNHIRYVLVLPGAPAR